jgi:hypothetical protein
LTTWPTLKRRPPPASSKVSNSVEWTQRLAIIRGPAPRRRRSGTTEVKRTNPALKETAAIEREATIIGSSRASMSGDTESAVIKSGVARQ